MKEKLIIPAKKYRGESGTVTARIPKELIARLDEIVKQTGRSRNDIIQLCIEYSLDNAEIE